MRKSGTLLQNLFCSVALTVAISAGAASAQLALEQPKMADVQLMQDSTTNQPMKMDFSSPWPASAILASSLAISLTAPC